MEKRKLYIITVMIVVLAFALVLGSSNLTGKSVLGKCIDSDQGDNPEVPGRVRFTGVNAVYKDVCYAEGGVNLKKSLKERYCIGDRMDNNVYLCRDGCLENEEGEGYCREGRAEIMK